MPTFSFGGTYTKKSDNTCHLTNIAPWIATSQSGRQVTDYLQCFGTRDQLLGVTSATRSARYNWADDPYKMLPRPVLSSLYTTPTTDPVPDATIVIKSVRHQCEMLSMTNYPQSVKLYYLTPKYDTNVNPIDFWSNLLIQKKNGQAAAGSTGDPNVPTVTSGSADGSAVGESPFIFKQFLNNWKIVASEKVVLQPGDSRNLKLEVNYNKVIRRSTLVTNRTSQFLAGLTVFPMVICRGALTGVQASGDIGGPAIDVTYGVSKVGFITTDSVHFGSLAVAKYDIARIHQGELINVNTTNFGASIINDMDDESAAIQA